MSRAERLKQLCLARELARFHGQASSRFIDLTVEAVDEQTFQERQLQALTH